MRLKELLKDIPMKNRNRDEIPDIDILGIADNSNDVRPGYIFIAIREYTTDGHDYILDALHKGATVIIGEEDLELEVPYIQVDNSRIVLSRIAQFFYGFPDRKKTMIGITGTNGKTTTSYLLKHILKAAGKRCTLIGSIETIVNGVSIPSKNTTPGSLDIYRLLHQSQDDFIIMEVSSHGIAQYRVEGLSFDYCLFTNLDHEHLDFHSSMEDYYQIKAQLFNQLKKDGVAVINCDNPWGERLKEDLEKKGKQFITLGQGKQENVQILYFDLKNSSCIVTIEDNVFSIQTALKGIHNLYNAIMAYKVAEMIGIPRNQIFLSLTDFRGIKGRFEMLESEQGAKVIIDYAHTKDAFFYILSTARYLGAKRIIHVFGFRGNRDTTKRKDMLLTSSGLSDTYILTFDDLNGVSEEEMLRQLSDLEETYGNGKGTITPDRTIAIKTALDVAKEGDWIIITGKGHEKYQKDFLLPASNDHEAVMIAQSISYLPIKRTSRSRESELFTSDIYFNR